MKSIEFNFVDFSKILNESLLEIATIIKNHKGVKHIIESRLSFEKWFQVELLFQIIEKTQLYNIELCIEKPVAHKTAKKASTIDLAILKSGAKFIGIELKIISTNYGAESIEKKQKKITDSISDFITDIEKPTNDNYAYSVSIAFVSPFPLDPKSRNYIDFKKQETKMETVSKIIKIPCEVSEHYNCYFYILHKQNKQIEPASNSL